MLPGELTQSEARHFARFLEVGDGTMARVEPLPCPAALEVDPGGEYTYSQQMDGGLGQSVTPSCSPDRQIRGLALQSPPSRYWLRAKHRTGTHERVFGGRPKPGRGARGSRNVSD